MLCKKALLGLVLACWLPLLTWAQQAIWADTAQLRADIAAISEEFGQPTIQWALVDTQGIVLQGQAGMPSLPRRRVASLSKVIVALGILRLASEGQLRLSDPVTQYLPDLPVQNPWAATDTLRIVHLLEHSSGLDEMHFNAYYASAPDLQLGDVFAKDSKPLLLRWPPGRFVAYSNVGYAIAAHLIEQVTQQQADDWLEGHILLPIGMQQSFFEHWERRVLQQPAVEHGYRRGKRLVPRAMLLYPAIGLVSTLEDQGKLLQFLLRAAAGKTASWLSQDQALRMFRAESSPWAASAWYESARGLAFTLDGPVQDAAGHATGYLDGALAGLGILPRHGQAWVYLAGGSNQDNQMIARLHRRLDQCFSQLRWEAEGMPQAGPLPAPPLGHYQYASARNALFAFYDDLYAGFELHGPKTAGSNLYELENGAGERLNVQLLGPDHNDLVGQQAESRALILPLADGKAEIIYQGKHYLSSPADQSHILRRAWQSYTYIVYLGWVLLVIGLLGKWKGTMFGKGSLSMSILANLPYLAARWAFAILQTDDVLNLGRMSLLSGMLFLLSILLPLASFGAILPWLRLRMAGAVSWWKWAHLPLIAGNIGLAAYLISYKMLPFCAWSY